MDLKKIWYRLQKIPTMQKIFMVQNLGVMIKVGISLSDALKTLAAQTTSKKLRMILIDLQQKVEKGTELGKSLEIYEHDFGELFINMIKAGEASGKLEDVLAQLYTQIKKDHDISSKVKGAMIYPIIVVTAMIVVGILMMIYVIPSLTSIFKEVDVPLPLATRVLIVVSDFLVVHGIWVALGAMVIVVSIARVLTLEKGKLYFDRFILNTPIISPIVKKINLARFSRTLSSLLRTDISIIQTLQITSQVITNRPYRHALEEASEKVKKGVRLAEIFSQYPKLFPPLIIQMLAVGEETGAIDDILEKIAVFYEDDTTNTMNTLPSIIEPVLMVVLGIAVAGMAVAIIMPMYSLTESI